ncbi:MAG TPA: choice-of-anchor D domain-containing protein [Verrucomicrobiales bacterium]|nr:choice-of-anchor D domain-containing protein [Verrucomicrobiales bacterium]
MLPRCRQRRALAALLLLSTPAPAAANLVWSGTFNGQWRFNAGFPNTNWGGQLPTGGDDILTFPAGGSNKTMDNDMGDDLECVQLRFTGAGYTLGGDSLILVHQLGTGEDPEIAVTHGAGTTQIEVDISTAGSLPVIVTNAAATLELNREITTGGNIDITGMGTVKIGGIQDAVFESGFTVGSGSDAPVLFANATMTGNVTVKGGATLAGRAICGNAAADTLTVNGILSPGDPAGGAFGPGTVTIAGNLVFSSTAEFVCDLTSTGSGFDRLAVSDAGTVTADGAIVRLLPTRAFPVGTVFRLIDNAGTDAIDNTPPFRLPNGTAINEGTEVNVGVNRFRFSYVNGGNDFAATVVAAPPSGVREWDAGGSTQLMSEATNWSLNLLPVSSNTLRFGTAAPAAPLAERFPVNDVGGNFYRLEFLASGYNIEESSASALTDLTLTAGIEASHASGGVTFDQDLILAADQTYALTDAGFMRFGLNNSIDLKGFNLAVNNTSTGEFRFNGPLKGTGGLTKTGSGYVLMSSSSVSTYTGGTVVEEGELRLSRSSPNNAVPGTVLTIGGAGDPARVTTTVTEQIADAVAVTLLPLGSLEPGALETIAALNLNGGSVGGTGVLAVAGNITATESATITAPVQVNGSVRIWDVAAGKTVRLDGALTVSPASTGVTQRKTGSGTLQLTGSAADTTISLDAGELIMDIATPNTASVRIVGGVLEGGGQVHDITGTASGGAVGPGRPGATADVGTTAVLGCTRVTLNAATSFVVDISGTVAGSGYDVLSVAAGTSTGQVALNNAKLVLREKDTVSIPPAANLLILDNDGTDAVSGTFAGLPQGAVVSSDRGSYTISYTGGTGNDIVLTRISAPEMRLEFNGNEVNSGDTAFISAAVVRQSSTGTFTVRNVGSAALNFTGTPRVQITGTDAASFSVVNQPPASLSGSGSTTTFTIQFAPSFGGFKEALVTIPNNDTDEGSFSFRVTSSALQAPIITASAITPPAGGNPGTVNVTVAGANANFPMRLEGSSNLLTWTTLRNFTTDAIGGAVTGVTVDPGSSTSPRRYYRAVTVPP